MSKAKVIELADYGTKESRAKAGERMVFEERSATEGKAVRGRVIAPCEWLAKRGLITREQATAGEYLARDWYDAGLVKATTVNLFGIRGGPIDYTPKQLKARDGFNAAMRFLGAGLAETAYAICILECSVGEMEAAQGWRKGCGMPTVKIMFRQLALHYKTETIEDQKFQKLK